VAEPAYGFGEVSAMPLRAARRAVVAVLTLTLLPRCQSSSDSDACTRAGPRAGGPGDPAELFPTATGSVWYYAVSEDLLGLPPASGRVRVEVTGTEVVGGTSASTFTTTQLVLGTPSTSAAVAEGPSGVTLVRGEDPGGVLSAQVVPYQLLYFPLEPGSSFVQVDCRNVEVGDDLDDDGRGDRVDVRSVVTAAPTETVGVPVGTFVASRIDTSLTMTFHLTTGGSVPASGLESQWYAPGVGLVRSTTSVSVEGISLTDRTELVAYDVGGVRAGFPEVAALATGELGVGEVARGGSRGYAAAVAPGTQIAATLFPLGDLSGLSVYGEDPTLGTAVCVSPPLAAGECRLAPTSSPLYLAVDGAALVGASARFAILVAPPPAIPAPADEVAVIPLGTPTVGQVGPRGQSRYTTSGLTPGRPVTVGIASLGADADLRIYTDATRSIQIPCTLDHMDVGTWPEACTFVPDPPGTTELYFDVLSGELEREGASYLIVVVEGP
jgi:hypothetical protein